jgi:hypothetical protein
MLKKLYLSVLLLLPILSWAQNTTYMTGNVFDNEQRSVALQGVAVRNINTKAVVVTDKDGHFAIPAKTGDLLSYALMGYETDTVYLVNLFPKNIYLRTSVNNLSPVNITTAKISPYLDTKDPNATPARQVDAAKERGGLRLNLGFGKYRRQQAKEAELEEAADINEEISKNFNKQVIQKLVNYNEKDLDDYIGLYRPTVAQIKAETPFNYTYYIATTFHEWQKLPPEARKLPPLPKLKAKP